MNPIELIEREILAALPAASTKIRRPRDLMGVWWLDVWLDRKAGGQSATVEWSPRRCGFGVCTCDDHGYGEGPDEVVERPEDACELVLRRLTPAQTSTK